MDAHRSIEGSGTLECMDHAAAVMLHLGNLLSPSDKKIRVTIERDPGTGQFTMKREFLPYRMDAEKIVLRPGTTIRCDAQNNHARGLAEICEEMKEQLRHHLKAETELHFLMMDLLQELSKM